MNRARTELARLWRELTLPIADALYLADGTAYEVTARAGGLVLGPRFDLLAADQDWMTRVDITREHALPDGTPPGDPQRDAALLDGAPPDGPQLDGSLPDGTLPGGAQLDGALADSAPPGGVLPGGTQFDGALPGGLQRSGSQPGGVLPDGTPLDGTLSNGALPGGALPDGARPGGAQLNGSLAAGSLTGDSLFVGDGAHGSEGVFGRIGAERGLVWIVYLAESNPFTGIALDGRAATFTSTSGVAVTVDIDHPDRAS